MENLCNVPIRVIEGREFFFSFIPLEDYQPASTTTDGINLLKKFHWSRFYGVLNFSRDRDSDKALYSNWKIRFGTFLVPRTSFKRVFLVRRDVTVILERAATVLASMICLSRKHRDFRGEKSSAGK